MGVISVKLAQGCYVIKIWLENILMWLLTTLMVQS